MIFCTFSRLRFSSVYNFTFMMKPIVPECKVPVRRLVWIRCVDNCNFCEDPKGDVYFYYTDIYTKEGFVSCGKCRPVATETLDKYHAETGWDKLVPFLGKTITAREVHAETNTLVSDLYILRTGTLYTTSAGVKAVVCENREGQIVVVEYDSILANNTPVVTVSTVVPVEAENTFTEEDDYKPAPIPISRPWRASSLCSCDQPDCDTENKTEIAVDN